MSWDRSYDIINNTRWFRPRIGDPKIPQIKTTKINKLPDDMINMFMAVPRLVFLFATFTEETRVCTQKKTFRIFCEFDMGP